MIIFFISNILETYKCFLLRSHTTNQANRVFFFLSYIVLSNFNADLYKKKKHDTELKKSDKGSVTTAVYILMFGM